MPQLFQSCPEFFRRNQKAQKLIFTFKMFSLLSCLLRQNIRFRQHLFLWGRDTHRSMFFYGSLLWQAFMLRWLWNWIELFIVWIKIAVFVTESYFDCIVDVSVFHFVDLAFWNHFLHFSSQNFSLFCVRIIFEDFLNFVKLILVVFLHLI